MRIALADSEVKLQRARLLFEEYAASLPNHVCLQDFERESTGLPGEYGLPAGRLFLALTDTGEAAGCVALRPLEPAIGELKRLFVRPAFRGMGLGKKLTMSILDEAARIGYERIRLDTMPTMAEAISLYASLGFRHIEAYGRHPIAGAVHMEIVLNSAEGHIQR